MSEEVQTFRATSGRVTGALGVVLSAVVAVMFVVSEDAPVAVPGVLACAFFGVLIWAAMLRPRVSTTATELRLTTMFESATIPLAAVEGVMVRRYLLVRAGGRKYICPAIGRSLRKTVRTEMKWNGGSQILAPGLGADGKMGSLQTEAKGDPELAYADFVEQQIVQLADTDRARRGIEARSEEEYELGAQVVRRRAWPVIVLLAVLGAAFAVSLAVLG
jgi:hypothetical protein